MIIDVDDHRAVLQEIKSGISQCSKLSIHQEELAFPMTKYECHSFSIQAVVNCIQYRAAEGDPKMRLEHGRGIGGQN
ncbi:hypothetical protein D3C73_1335080 [compost metagenome]